MSEQKKWDYRVVRTNKEDGTPANWYSIQEVYFDDKNKPYAYTIDLQVEGDTITEMRKRLEGMIKCLEEPVLDEQDIIPKVHDTEDKYIYESPDGGNTIYRRKFGEMKREKV